GVPRGHFPGLHLRAQAGLAPGGRLGRVELDTAPGPGGGHHSDRTPFANSAGHDVERPGSGLHPDRSQQATAQAAALRSPHTADGADGRAHHWRLHFREPHRRRSHCGERLRMAWAGNRRGPGSDQPGLSGGPGGGAPPRRRGGGRQHDRRPGARRARPSLTGAVMRRRPFLSPCARAGWAWPAVTPALVAVVALIILVLLAVVGPVLWSSAATRIDLTISGQPPSGAHPLGTDRLGRDILARTLTATRLSLELALIAAGLAAAIGFAFG